MRNILLSLPLLFVCSDAVAQTWTHEYSVGKTADEITSCNARINFSDGIVAVRIFGDEMDIFFYQNSLSVPSNEVLGNVALTFKSEVFVAEAFSGKGDSVTTSAMFFTPAKADYEKILNAMRYGSEMLVVFPDSTSFGVRLDKSNKALADAATCWLSKPTGPAGKNPFLGSSGNNPFD